MEKTERALMISLDALIDTFNFNAEIKTTELAKWVRDAISASPMKAPHSAAQINKSLFFFFMFADLADRLNSWKKLAWWTAKPF